MSATKSTLVRTAAAVLFAAASSAWAQDYTVTAATGLLETRPASATPYSITSSGAGTFATASLPFSFPYYGTIVSDVTITPDGFALLRAASSIPNANDPNAAHGQNGSAFPYSQTGTGGAGTQNVDGLVAAAWSNQFRVNESPYGGTVYTWTSGAAPSRRFVISWDNAKVGTNTNVPFTMQIQLYEGTGRIVLAYSPAGTYSTAYVCGIDSPVDARFTAPLLSGVNNSGYPGSDFILDPRAATFTGAVLYDKTTSDETGIGNTIQSSRPLAGLRLELRAGGVLAAQTTTASDGSFSITGLGLPATPTGSIAVLAQNAACRVSTGSGVATEWAAASNVPLSAGSNLGVQTLGVGADPGGDLRGAMNVALDCGAAYDWASARTTTSIPRVETYLDPASTTATIFQKPVGPAAASLRIGSRAAADPDMWDDAVVTKVYARYVLSIIAGVPLSAYDDRFDAVTDAQNAFAEGFGHYLWAVVSGATRTIDGTGASTASVDDLETPAVASPKSDAVAGCVAGALYDLQDAANETTDPVDGRSTQDRVFLAADALSVAPTAATFLQSWIDAGYDAPGATRVFVANGALADDALEPNDSIDETAPMGEVGFARPALVLNRFNEDWFSVTLAADAPSIAADAKYDASGTGATVAVEIRDAGGTSLATGTLVPATGAVHAATGPVTAGTYKIGVRHVSGPTVPSYVFQAYQPMSMPPQPIADWTLGREYDRPLGVVGGIPPFTATMTGAPLPPGLGLNSTTLRAIGIPNAVGTTRITIEVKDGGSPANVVTRSQTLVIHDVLRLPGRSFLGFPEGVAVDLDLPATGGTPPFTFATTSGSLPAGLSFAPNSLHVTGTAAAQTSAAIELDGVDVAGSADHVATRAVVAAHVAAKNTPAQLAAGVDACGWWFDAVLGSTVTFSVNTAKKNVKRALDGRLLAPDASAVATGKIKDTYGTIRASKLVCPSSGRYYFIADSQDSGAATQLLGTLGVALPKSGKGSSKSFAPTDTTTFQFGAVPGSTATVKFAGDKKAGLVATVVSVLDPTGTPVPFASHVKPTAVGGTMTLPLESGGTWTVVLGATSTTDAPGKYSYSYSIQQKKGSVYVAE